MEPVQITEEEAYALSEAMQKEQKAQMAVQIAALRQQWMEAVEAKNELIAGLAGHYGFTRGAELQYDAQTRTLSERNGNGSNIR